MSNLAPGLRFNYSLYAVPVGWVISMAPLWWAVATTKSANPHGYRNNMPQESWAQLKGKVPDDLYRKVTRAVAAGNNCHTNLAWFTASLAAANAAHVDCSTLHNLAATWIVSRVAYNLSYIFIETEAYSAIRSGLYWAGALACMGLTYYAAEQYAKVPW